MPDLRAFDMTVWLLVSPTIDYGAPIQTVHTAAIIHTYRYVINRRWHARYAYSTATYTSSAYDWHRAATENDRHQRPLLPGSRHRCIDGYSNLHRAAFYNSRLALRSALAGGFHRVRWQAPSRLTHAVFPFTPPPCKLQVRPGPAHSFRSTAGICSARSSLVAMQGLGFQVV